jgi:hypothetical protein
VWRLELSGCPCTIRVDKGEWVVVLASSIARSNELAKAIQVGSGGMVSAAEAEAAANLVRPRR